MGVDFITQFRKVASEYIEHKANHSKTDAEITQQQCVKKIFNELGQKFYEQQDKIGTFCYKASYGLDSNNPLDKEILFKIAKIAAEADGHNTSQYIKNYGFNPEDPRDKEQLFTIAKIAAARDGSGVSKYIKNYGFNPEDPLDKERLFEILKIAAAQNGWETCNYIRNYGFGLSSPENQKQLFEIAKIAARALYSEHATSLFILLTNRPFKFTEEQAFCLFSELYLKNPSAFSENRHDCLNFLKKVKNIFILIETEDFPALEKLVPKAGSIISALSALGNQNNPELKISAQQYLGFLLCQGASLENSDVFFHNVETLKIVPLLEKVYDPELRIQIINQIGKSLGQTKIVKEEASWLQLPILLFDTLFPGDIGRDVIIKTTRNLRDGKLSKALMKTLIQLALTSSVSKEESIQLLKKALSEPKSFTKSLNQINCLYANLNLDGGDLLHEALKNEEFTFSSELEKAFKRKLPLIAEENNFTDQFSTTFNASRDPFAIFKYTASLSKLNGEIGDQALKSLSTFITSVLNNTFSTERMKLENNPHLTKLHELHPEFLKKWTEEISKELSIEITPSKTTEEVRVILSFTDNPYDTLLCGTEVDGSCLNINGNPALNRGLFGYFFNGHRMIIMKGASESLGQTPMIARSAIRALLDSDGKIVLFLDWIYPDILKEPYKAAMKKFALEVAKRMDCPLVSAKEGDESRPYGKELKSYGGREYESVDSSIGGKIEPGAPYSIMNANYVT